MTRWVKTPATGGRTPTRRQVKARAAARLDLDRAALVRPRQAVPPPGGPGAGGFPGFPGGAGGELPTFPEGAGGLPQVHP